MDSPELIPVAVVIPCYRCSETIERAVESVYAQTMPPSEIFLIEDCSNDSELTIKVLDRISKNNVFNNITIKIIKLKNNGGPGLARNVGWDMATQPWIAFLDADDIWHPRKLEIQFSWLQEHSEVLFCAHETLLFENHFHVLGSVFVAVKLSFKKLLFKNVVPTRSVMVKRDIRLRFEGKAYTEDYLLWLLILREGNCGYKIPQVLAYSLRPEFSFGGYSGDLWKHEKRELNSFKYLYQGRYISFPFLIIVSSFSMIKYFRRLLNMTFSTKGSNISC